MHELLNVQYVHVITPQIAYKVAICPRRNLLNNQIILYCYLITSLICVLKVNIGPSANLLNIQISLYCDLITSYFIKGLWCSYHNYGFHCTSTYTI